MIKIEIIEEDGHWLVYWSDEYDAAFATKEEAVAWVHNILGHYYLNQPYEPEVTHDYLTVN